MAGKEHEGLTGEFGQGDPVVAGEPVIGGQRGQERLGEQGLQPYPWRRRGRAQETGVDPPGGQRGELLVVEALADRDLDHWVGVPVGPDDRGQQAQRDRGQDRDGQFSPVAAGGEPGQPDRAVGLGQGPPRLAEHGPAGLAQDDPPAGPVEQGDAERPLQVADLP